MRRRGDGMHGRKRERKRERKGLRFRVGNIETQKGWGWDKNTAGKHKKSNRVYGEFWAKYCVGFMIRPKNLGPLLG